jgi:hypothetical protein
LLGLARRGGGAIARVARFAASLTDCGSNVPSQAACGKIDVLIGSKTEKGG